MCLIDLFFEFKTFGGEKVVVTGNPPCYVVRELLSYWAEKDPLPNYRDYCLSIGANEKQLISMEEEEQAIVDAARKEMEEMPWPEGNTVTK